MKRAKCGVHRAARKNLAASPRVSHRSRGCDFAGSTTAGTDGRGHIPDASVRSPRAGFPDHGVQPPVICSQRKPGNYVRSRQTASCFPTMPTDCRRYRPRSWMKGCAAGAQRRTPAGRPRSAALVHVAVCVFARDTRQALLQRRHGLISAARADTAWAVADNPLASCAVEIQSRRGSSSRHRCTIFRIAWGVV